MIRRAYAKLNLGLKVLYRQPDGYHALEMVMLPITLFDQLDIQKIPSGIELTVSHPYVPTDKRNSIVQAYDAMKHRYQIGGLKVHVKKMIPMQAGLAGGSSDAAAVLHAINDLYQLNLSHETLAEIGLTIGADVPFCVYQHAARVTGIGDRVERINQNIDAHVLLVKPRRGLSTKAIFGGVDVDQLNAFSNDTIIQALEQGDYDLLTKSMCNHLESVAYHVLPEIKDIKDDMISLGFDAAMMTGSGSTVFALTKDTQVLEKGYQFFKGKRVFAFKCQFK